MMREGRRHCTELDAALSDAGIASISPGARRLVRRHVDSCEVCQKTQSEMVSPTAILGAFVPLQAAPDIKAAIFANVMDQWSGVSQGDGGSFASQATTRVPVGGAAGVARQAAWYVSRVFLAGVLLAIAGLVLVIVALINPFGQSDAASGDAGATIIFTSEAGDPVVGVALIVEYLPPGTQVPTLIPALTDETGRIDLSDTGPGTYVLRIQQLPPEYAAADLGQSSAFIVEDGEQLDITGVFRTTGS